MFELVLVAALVLAAGAYLGTCLWRQFKAPGCGCGHEADCPLAGRGPDGCRSCPEDPNRGEPEG